MKESSLYGHVVELLGLIDRSRKPADEIVAEFFRGRRYLGARDRRFIADAVYDIVRNAALVDRIVQTAVASSPASMPDIEARPFSRLLAYLLAIRALGKAEIEAAAGSLWTSYVRGVPLQDSFDTLASTWSSFHWPESAAEQLALRYSIPREVTVEWVDRLGSADAESLCKASNAAPPVAIRVNTLLCSRQECRESLLLEGIESVPTPLSPVGLIFPKRTSVQALQTFRRGCFEMQDEGSQILSYLTQAQTGQAILDACAGAGGKTLHLAALMGNTGTLVATDGSRRRLDNLRERSRRAGATTIRVSDPEEHGKPSPDVGYDTVLVDAPCSGTGTYRRNPWLKQTFTESMLEQMVQTQRGLLRRYAEAVKPGGRLVYATCSLLSRENEGQVEAFLRERPDFAVVPAAGILQAAGIVVDMKSEFLELLPHRHGTDGFFGAVLARKR